MYVQYCMSRKVCPQRYIQKSMSRKACSVRHVQKCMSRQACPERYAHKSMTTKVERYVQECMSRKACPETYVHKCMSTNVCPERNVQKGMSQKGVPKLACPEIYALSERQGLNGMCRKVWSERHGWQGITRHKVINVSKKNGMPMTACIEASPERIATLI